MLNSFAYSLLALQDLVLGVDILDQERMDEILGPKKGNRDRGVAENKMDEIEAPPVWELEMTSVAQSPIGIERQDILIFGAA